MKTLSIFTIVLTIIFASSIPNAAETEEMLRSGFLSTYDGLKQTDEYMVEWLFFDEKANFNSYDKIILDYLQFFVKEDAEYKGLQANEMQELAEAFHQSVIKALSDKYQFVSEPGPGVMRIRLALTNVEPIKLGRNFLTAVVPVGMAINLVKVGATGESIGVGRTSMEAEIFDTQTKIRLVAAIDTDVGRKYTGYQGDTKWAHAEGTFEAWAKDLRKLLNKLSGRE